MNAYFVGISMTELDRWLYYAIFGVGLFSLYADSKYFFKRNAWYQDSESAALTSIG